MPSEVSRQYAQEIRTASTALVATVIELLNQCGPITPEQKRYLRESAETCLEVAWRDPL